MENCNSNLNARKQNENQLKLFKINKYIPVIFN